MVQLPLKKNGVAFFDLDGPLRGGSAFDWPKFLLKEGLITPKQWQPVTDATEKYKKGTCSYRELGIIIGDVYANTLKGKKVSDLERLAKKFVSTPEISKLHAHSIDLVKTLDPHCVTCLVTGEPIEVAREFARVLGINEVNGTTVQSRNDIYTGKLTSNNIVFEGKKESLRGLFRKHQDKIKKSFAFGDQLEDRVMLGNVEVPIALNPDSKLKALAEKQHWIICESQNVLEQVRARLKAKYTHPRKIPRSKRKKLAKKIQTRFRRL